MSSAVAELEAGLHAMLSLKPPGVSGSRIQNLTALCTANVQSESVLVQKLYTHFKKAPGTHKLGVLYVVDSVTRKWTELAKSAGQPINSSAQDGTYAAGVHRVKELLPVLMNDIAQSTPDDQKEKIRKLIDIWEKGQTFPLQMLNSFKEKLNTPSQNRSTTPPGSPPANTLGQQQPSTAAPNTSSILAALANMARQQNTAAPPPAHLGVQNQDSLYSMPNAQNNPAQQVAALTQSLQVPSVAPPVNMPGPGAAFAQHLQGANGAAQNYASNPSNPYTTAPTIAPSAGTLDPAVQQQLVLIKSLSDAGVAPDQIAGIIAQLGNQGGAAGGLLPNAQYPPQNQIPNAQTSWSGRLDESRDQNAYPGNVRSPGQYRRRSRSPSPHRGWNARDSPSSRRRDDGYDHGRDSPSLNRDDRGRGGSRPDYRQRSPPRRGHSATPPSGYGGGEKWVGHEASIPKGSIKVLSRTLFVGGVTCTEQELRRTFERLGQVQTCIVNREKRHAFVKMVTRADALAAKEAMERPRGTESQLRTRWGVGFGPRDCSDYQTGVSIIPISKLTDADRKWMLSAEYGGSGGKPIESGMVVEEPDIEIGQGVSSKAISRRMQTDKSGSNGPKSSRDREDDEAPRRRRGSRDDHRDGGGRKDDRYPTASAPPSMPSIPPFGIPGFPFQMPTLQSGMPMFPPGFVLPGQQQPQNQTPQQPPPPGHRT